MTDDERFNKWGEWIMTIHEDVENAILNRHIRHEVAAIIDSNPRIQRPSSFYEWMAAVYSDSGLMAVRRQLDIDLQSVSLARLLTEIVAYPSVLSRDRFVGLYRVELQAVAHREFDRHVGSGANNIDPAVVQAESDDLRQRTRDVGRYGTKRVAHLDEKGPKNIPTFQELDDALDLINALRVKVPPPPARSFVPGAGVGLRLEGDLPGTVDDPLTAIHLSRQSARESNGVRKKPLVAAPACLTIELDHMSHESSGPTDTNLQQRLYEVCKAAFDEGLARAESYDRKAQIVFGISGALLAFMLGRLNDTLSAIRTAGVLGWSILAIYMLADVALAAALILGIAAVMPRTYKSYPEPSEVLRKFSSKDVREIDLLASVAKYFAENTDKNERSNHRRSVYLKLSVGALVVGVVLVLAFIAISAVSAASSPSVQREATSNGTRGLTAGNQEDSGHEEVHEATTEGRTP